MIESRFLTLTDEEKIYQAAFEILAKTGILVEDSDVSDKLLELGCSVSSGRILIKEEIIELAISSIPAELTLYNRDGSPACILGNGETYCQTVGGTPFVIRGDNSEPTHASLIDLQEIIRLVDNLENIHIVTSATTPTDVDAEIQPYIGFATGLMYSSKPSSVPGPVNEREVRRYYNLAEAAIGAIDLLTKPRFLISILPVSPLKFPAGLGKAIVESARLGLPISIVPLPVMGVSAPYNFAAALAQQHAENLATIVIAQMTNPGLAMVYHGRLSVGDMRTGASVWGFFEVGYSGAIAVALGKRVGIPTNVYGFCTSAKTPNIQSGSERMFNSLLPLLAGADVLGGAGSLGDIMAVSTEQLVIDNELMAWLLEYKKKKIIEERGLGIEVIDHVSRNVQGSFIGEMDTVLALKQKRQWLGDLCDRDTFDGYEKSGRKGMGEMAREEVTRILDQTDKEPIISKENQKDVLEVLDSIQSGIL